MLLPARPLSHAYLWCLGFSAHLCCVIRVSAATVSPLNRCSVTAASVRRFEPLPDPRRRSPQARRLRPRPASSCSLPASSDATSGSSGWQHGSAGLFLLFRSHDRDPTRQWRFLRVRSTAGSAASLHNVDSGLMCCSRGSFNSLTPDSFTIQSVTVSRFASTAHVPSGQDFTGHLRATLRESLMVIKLATESSVS